MQGASLIEQNPISLFCQTFADQTSFCWLHSRCCGEAILELFLSLFLLGQRLIF